MKSKQTPQVELREKLYEGKAKIVYATDRPGLIVQYFKDDATAFNALKRGTIVGKGVVNNQMSAALFQRLGRAGVPTHYVATLSEREMLCRRLDIIKIETIVRNVVAGSLAKRTGLEEGTAVGQPIVELYYKSDPLGDPMITEEHVRLLRLATPREVSWLRRMALKVNRVLRPYLAGRGLLLVDFKLEFGRSAGRLWLGDEISPDTCRLWDATTRAKLDKDRFRQDLGGVEDAYQEVYRRVVQNGAACAQGKPPDRTARTQSRPPNGATRA
jgi:phosphoribosylaminoimidazole-succinocarboxamide synthase